MRKILLLTLILILSGCSLRTEKDTGHLDDPYSAYLENEATRATAKKKGDLETLRKAWNRNTILLEQELTDTLELALMKQRLNLSASLFPIDTTIAITYDYENRAIAKKDSSTIADAWFRLSYYYGKAKDNASSELYAYKSLQIAKECRDTTIFTKVSVNIGIKLNANQNYPASQRIATEALSYDPPDKQKLKLYSILAISCAGQLNFKEKIYWTEKALKLVVLPYDRLVLSNNLAMGHYRLGRKQKSLTLLDTLSKDTLWMDREVMKNGTKATEYARILYNLAQVKYDLGMEGPKELIEESEAILVSLDRKQELSRLYLQKAQFYHKNLVKARQLALSSLNYAQQSGMVNIRKEALKLLTEISPRPKAYAIEYQRLTDSIHEEIMMARDNYARYQYDVDQTREKNKQLELQGALQDEKIKYSRTRSLILLVGLLILSGLAYQNHRLTRARALLTQSEEVRKTESRIAKRIHDELANDLYNTMTFAELNRLDEADNKDHLMNTLEDLYKRTRNVSRENAGLPKGSDFGKILASLISQYRSPETNILIRGLADIKWDKLADNKQETLYRVIQELLVNMRKHSQASLVALSFTQEDKKLVLEYKDNGKGLPGDHIPAGGGIENMESRLTKTGGHFKLESAEGKGVRVKMVYG